MGKAMLVREEGLTNSMILAVTWNWLLKHWMSPVCSGTSFAGSGENENIHFMRRIALLVLTIEI